MLRFTRENIVPITVIRRNVKTAIERPEKCSVLAAAHITEENV